PDDPLVKAQTYLPEALKHVTFFEHKDKESEDDFEGKDSDCKVGLVTSVLHNPHADFHKASTVAIPTKRKDFNEFFNPSQRPKTEVIPESISPSNEVNLISNISPSNELKQKASVFSKSQVQTQTQKILSSTTSNVPSLKLTRDKNKDIPLSEKIRPRTLKEFFGQT
ncbi:hypothetical protein CONCODRAFT_19008, partial [Conidiobolus coronatus NRRL 28638]